MQPDWSEVVQVVGRAEAFGTVGVALEGPGERRWSHHGHRVARGQELVELDVRRDPDGDPRVTGPGQPRPIGAGAARALVRHRAAGAGPVKRRP